MNTYRGIALILGRIKSKAILLVDNFGDIVSGTRVVEHRIALNRKVRRIPDVTVVERRRDDVNPENQGCEDVHDGPCWHHDW